MHLVRMSQAPAMLMGFCLAALSCAKQPTTEGPLGKDQMVTVYKAPGGRGDRTVRQVVKDSTTWRALWDSLSGDAGSPPEPPAVDFRAAMLVVAAGPRVGAGDSVIIRDVRPEGRGLRASIMAYRQCAPLDVSPVPVHVVQVPRVDGPVRFEEDTTNTSVCPPSP
jgi:hypothetical protein